MLGVVVNTGMNTDFGRRGAGGSGAAGIPQPFPGNGDADRPLPIRHRAAGDGRPGRPVPPSADAGDPALRAGARGGGDPGGPAGGAVGDDGGRRENLAPTKAIVCGLTAIEELAGGCVPVPTRPAR